MKLATAGVCANLFLGVMGISAYVSERGSESLASTMTMIALAFWILSVIGLILMVAGKRKVGAALTIIGSLFFVPLGFVAIYGARSVMMAETKGGSGEQDLDERRRLASTTLDQPK